MVMTIALHAVIDVYSAWCGPCKAIQGLLRRLKNEIGDDLLRFAMVCAIFVSVHAQMVKVKVHLQAKSDTIESLEPYRDKSIPTFLMFGVRYDDPLPVLDFMTLPRVFSASGWRAGVRDQGGPGAQVRGHHQREAVGGAPSAGGEEREGGGT